MTKYVAQRGAGTMARLWNWSGAATASGIEVVSRFAAMPSSLRLEISPTLSPWAPVVVSEPVAVDPTTASAKFTVASGLSPDTPYFAAERQGAFLTPSPFQFRTFPVTGNIRWGHSSCWQNSGTNQDKVCAALVAEAMAVLMHTGDWYYYNPDTTDEAVHRADYDATLAKAGVKSVHAAMGVNSNVSDHEINNDSDRTNVGVPAARAVFGYFRPHYAFPVANCLYQRWRMSDLDCISLDTRTCRDPKAQTDDVNKTMLGAAQSAQLVSDLTNWVRPFGPIPIFSDCEVGGPTTAGRDNWNGYHFGNPGGRRWLFDLIESLGLGSRVVLCTGDMHSSGTDLGANHRYSTSGTIQVKVVAASPIDQSAVGGFATYSEGGQFLPAGYGNFAFDGQWARMDWAYSGGATGVLTATHRRCHPLTGAVSTLRTTPMTFVMA